jgi:hypothetical protein
MRSKYKSDNGGIHLIVIRPETLTLTLAAIGNSPPSGSVTNPPFARGSSARFSFGVNARLVRFQFAAAPPGYKQGGVLSIPWLDGDTWPSIQAATTGTYRGLEIEVLSYAPEKVV